MDDRLYRLLKATAIVLVLGWGGYAVYESFFMGKDAGVRAYEAANRLFEDRQYERALQRYEESLRHRPDATFAMRGRALTLMQLGRHAEALEAYAHVIAAEPELAVNYANRGILLDRIGQHERALADYERALSLDEAVAEGPHWLTRFLRNQPERPPTIADRARYLREQLALPESERVLRIPEVDEQQRPYKM
jgi:tetratricopeptide (TPR) repeat protein